VLVIGIVHQAGQCGGRQPCLLGNAVIVVACLLTDALAARGAAVPRMSAGHIGGQSFAPMPLARVYSSQKNGRCGPQDLFLNITLDNKVRQITGMSLH